MSVNMTIAMDMAYGYDYGYGLLAMAMATSYDLHPITVVEVIPLFCSAQLFCA